MKNVFGQKDENATWWHNNRIQISVCTTSYIQTTDRVGPKLAHSVGRGDPSSQHTSVTICVYTALYISVHLCTVCSKLMMNTHPHCTQSLFRW